MQELLLHMMSAFSQFGARLENGKHPTLRLFFKQVGVSRQL